MSTKEDSNYYHLWCTAMGSAEGERCWVEQFKSDHPRCQGCGAHLTEWGAVDAYASHIERSDFNFVDPPIIDYFSTALISCFSDAEAARGLYLGKLYDAQGRRVEKYVTVGGRYELNLRGNEESTYRVCELCGREVYFPIGPPYLLPHSIASGEPIYAARVGFVIKEDIANRIMARKRRWKHARVSKLSILDAPRDGRPDLLI